MKKILLYTDTPQIGGAELQLFLLAKFLNKNEFTPILACSSTPSLDKWCENFEKENIKVIRLNVRHKHDPRHYTELKKIISAENIDIFHAHVWNPASCRFAFAAANSAKIPTITTEHDPFKLSILKDLIKKSTLNHIAKIITVSRNNAQILRDLYPKHAHKISIIHNGIDLDWWRSQLLRFTETDYKEIKEKTFLAKKNTLILTVVAELHERKGIRYLIEAIPEIVGQYPNVKLVVIGEGSERNSLESLVKKLGIDAHVILLGRQKNVPHLLKASNIFVLPSRREAFGLVLTEAMATPLPIVASKVGGIPEIVENGKNGLLVEPENPQALSRALLELIESPELREKMAEKSLKIVSENFDAKKMAEKYEEVYEKIS